MKNYKLQRKRGGHWHDIDGAESHLIHYMRGYQDATHSQHPTWTTRIVWMRGDEAETVRICGNWKPGTPGDNGHPVNETVTRVGASIRQRRHDCGMTLRQVSEQTGMAIAFLSAVENGKQRMTYDRLIRLSVALCTTVGQLCDEEKP